MKENNRIAYIDNIRITLTSLVILHHLLITYGAPGGWYYREFDFSELDLITLTLLVLVAAINQAFFMGFFFFLSGYFSQATLKKRSTANYLLQRLIRLGVPILLFVYLISPLLRLSFRSIMYQKEINLQSIANVYQRLSFGYELGPMWFVVLLLLLSIAFLPWQLRQKKHPKIWDLPSTCQILTTAIGVGLITFLIRIDLPVGYVFQPLNLQIPHTPQYLTMFLIGSMAFRDGWLEDLDQIQIKLWQRLGLGLLLVMPIIFIASGGLAGSVDPALGGFSWQSLTYSLWEQIFCATMIVLFLYHFQRGLGSANSFTAELAGSSYAAYIIHPLILVIYTALISPFVLHPLLKIAISIPPVLFLCFLAAGILRRLPILNKIL